jgi:sarcosine oxidase subunit alpha
MKTDVCVIGAGPAGLAAAALLARYGHDVVVVDETPEPGGRLLGQLHRIGCRTDVYHEDGWWHGRRIAGILADDAAAAGARVLLASSVWGIYPGWQVCVSGESPQIIDAERVIIATGATEVPIPIPGWTLPGVMTIGAAQVLATQHRIRPGNRGMVAGINPLALAIAHELHMAGTDVAGIVNVPPSSLAAGEQSPAAVIADLARASHLAPSWPLRVGGRLGTRPWAARLAARCQPRGGVRVWGIPIDPRRAVAAILGDGQVEGVVVADLDADGAPGARRTVAVDAVFLAGGLRPLPELAMLTGCRMIDVPDLGGTIPLYGRGLETTAPGVSVAGNVTGIEAATVAIAQGRLAAAAVACPDQIDDYRRQLARAREEAPIAFLPHLRRGHRTVARLWHGAPEGESDLGKHTAVVPPLSTASDDPFRGLPDDLIVCRCEEVTLGAFRRVAHEGFRSAEEIKRFTRMTMGACQGRVCQPILERIDAGLNGVPARLAPVPGHRPPVRPVALGELAALASGREEWERLHGRLLPSIRFDDSTAARLGDPRL